MVIMGYMFVAAAIVGFIIALLKDWSGFIVPGACATMFFLGLFFINNKAVIKDFQARKQEQITQGDYFINQCKLLEVNIDNGFFSSATNRLDCNGTLINIVKSEYDEDVKIYRESLSEAGKSGTGIASDTENRKTVIPDNLN